MKSKAALLLGGMIALNCGSTSAQSAPQTAPQDPTATTSDLRPGENLSQRLDRSNGVIKPPAGTDPAMAVPTPSTGPGSTPVIPPAGSPGSGSTVQPK